MLLQKVALTLLARTSSLLLRATQGTLLRLTQNQTNNAFETKYWPSSIGFDLIKPNDFIKPNGIGPIFFKPLEYVGRVVLIFSWIYRLLIILKDRYSDTYE